MRVHTCVTQQPVDLLCERRAPLQPSRMEGPHQEEGGLWSTALLNLHSVVDFSVWTLSSKLSVIRSSVMAGSDLWICCSPSSRNSPPPGTTAWTNQCTICNSEHLLAQSDLVFTLPERDCSVPSTPSCPHLLLLFWVVFLQWWNCASVPCCLTWLLVFSASVLQYHHHHHHHGGRVRGCWLLVSGSVGQQDLSVSSLAGS